MVVPEPTSVSIRRAVAADAPRLAAMRYGFRSELAMPTEPEQSFVARTAAWLESRLAQETWRAWLAVTPDDLIVGHVFAQLIEKIPNPIIEDEHILYFTNVYVIPPLRNHGVGTRLLQAALEDCRALAVDTMILWPSEQSRALYQRLGFAPPRELLERPLR